MNNQSRKIILILLSIFISALGVFISWKLKPIEERTEVIESHRLVKVSTVELGDHKAEVRFSGKLSAEDKIDVFTEVGGVLLTDNFKQGNTFSKGSVLVQLNATEFSNNLKAVKSQLMTQVAGVMGDLKMDYPSEAKDWEGFLNTIDVHDQLPELPEFKNEKLKRFMAGKGILNTFYSIQGQEDKLSKFCIYAPFNGVLTNTTLKKGTLVRPGQKIGEFINPASFELETEISLSDLQFIQKGSKVNLHSDDLNMSWQGVVSRINSSLDPSSQMVKIFIKAQGRSLKEGMFLHGVASGATFKNATQINRKLIKNGGVYIVENQVITHKKINVLYINQAKAIVTGLANGDQYIADNMKGLYEGMKVSMSN